MKASSVFAFFLPLLFASGIALSQRPAEQASSACSFVEPPFRLSKPNIFTDQQEQWLGDWMAEQQEPSYDLLPDKDSAELERIGRKLLAQLPPTPIVYHFRVYESAEANGFSLAGGYIYISRKLITDAHSEDEVAGVVSHEIGHIYTHQIAIAVTRQLKNLLNVTSLTARDDVADKLQLLVDAPWKDSAEESEDDQEKDELLADRVGMYALIKAGYAPRALSENLDRIAANKGKTGNFLTDILGTTSEISLRVRTTLRLIATLPGECGQRNPASSASFEGFQQALLNAPVHTLIEATPQQNVFKLQPPISEHLLQVRFSPDGNSILAQTDTAIHILDREPLKYKFSVDARGAEMARFSQDSAHLVFSYPSMRVEKWSVALGKREDFHEVIDYEGCQQTSLTPDGRTMVCLTKPSGVRLKLIDVDSGKPFVDMKGFFDGDSFGGGTTIVRQGDTVKVGTVLYTQDEKTMLIVAGARAIAYDLATRNTIPLRNDLSHLFDGRMAFVDSNKLVYDCDTDFKAMTSRDTFKVCESTFPDGMPVNNFRVGYQWIEPLTSGGNVLIGPFKAASAMLVDPATGNASAGFKMDSADLYNKLIASENERGGVSLSELGATKGESADLPVGPLYGMTLAEFSPDGRFLAYSSKTRSAIWDLTAQKRVSLMRPFRGITFDSQDVMFAQYQAANQQPGANYRIDMKTGKAAATASFAIDQFQNSDFLVTTEPLEKSGDARTNVNFHVADLVTGKELWMRHYGHEEPSLEHVHDGIIVLSFDVVSDSGNEVIKHAGGKLVKTSDFRSNWMPRGFLVELIDGKTGETRRILELPYLTSWNEEPRSARLFGDYLVARGFGNTSGIYRVSDGVRTGGFFGRVLTGDGKLGLLAITNHDQEVTILDATNGKRLSSVMIDQIPETARFIPEMKALLVLTASQTVVTLPLPDQSQATK